MKTRKLAAKALSAAVLATTVSGYAFAGDHNIGGYADWNWCTQSYETETTSATGGSNGSCSSTDWELEFSGKAGGGWSYFFEINPDSNSGAASGYTAGWKGTVTLTKDLGNGLTLSLGDTGDADQGKNFTGYEWANHAGGGAGQGGMKLAYAKGNLTAALVYGGKSYALDRDDSSINANVGFAFGKASVGASYHTYTPGADSSTYKANGMVFSAGYDLDSFSINGDFENKTESPNSGSASDKKYTYMSVNFWGTKGAFRPGVEFATSTYDGAGVSAAEEKGTNLAVGVKWYPAGWGATNAYAKYTSNKCSVGGTDNTAGASVCTAGNHSKIQVGIFQGLSIL